MISEFKYGYAFLSNFWPCQIWFEGLYYPSVENAYQAAKTDDLYLREQFLDYSAAKAKKLGRELFLRWDWEQRKSVLMRELVEQKFSKEPLRSMLLATGDEELIEGNWWGDTYWGVCRGIGENMLGKILMAVREHLK